MLKVRQCEMKFKEIRQQIEKAPNTPYKEAYIEHMESLKESYNKELLKALCRKEPPIGQQIDKMEISFDEKREIYGWN